MSGANTKVADDLKVTMDAGVVKGTVTITLYENKPPKARFNGKLVGSDMQVMFKAMLSGYRMWQHEKTKVNLGGK